jgi:hypothetical protein
MGQPIGWEFKLKDIDNRVRQGRWNAERIRELVCRYPVMTVELVSHVTGIPAGTVRNQLRKLAALKQVRTQRRGMGEQYLYRAPGKGSLVHIDHELGRSEVWIALEAGAEEKGIELERELPIEFESSKGTVKPDWIFSIRQPEREKYFFTWEEDKGSMRGKDECLKKYEGMWQWRKEVCVATKGVNRWSINTIRVLTSAEDEKRMQALRETSFKAHPEGKISRMFLFTHRGLWDYREPWKLYEPIWVTGDDDRLRSILE